MRFVVLLLFGLFLVGLFLFRLLYWLYAYGVAGYHLLEHVHCVVGMVGGKRIKRKRVKCGGLPCLS